MYALVIIGVHSCASSKHLKRHYTKHTYNTYNTYKTYNTYNTYNSRRGITIDLVIVLNLQISGMEQVLKMYNKVFITNRRSLGNIAKNIQRKKNSKQSKYIQQTGNNTEKVYTCKANRNRLD